MMLDVYDIFEEKYGDCVDCVLQKSGMKEEEREAFLGRFEEKEQEKAFWDSAYWEVSFRKESI